ncbi:MAG TPA: group 1 truncated hemoglobin [Steroidobacteraceae bacterium]|nr:group 1 truncated hemoglobin [Steroidobacteraceae bacterium]
MAYRNRWLAGTFTLLAAGISTATIARTPALAPPPAIAPAGSLYERLGGTQAVTAIVADTVDKVVANPETNRPFDKANLQNAKDMLVEQICALTGGGCSCSSEPTLAVYASEDISDTEFFGLVEALRESMRAREVPLAARNQLLEVLTPMKRVVAKL